MGQVVEGYPLSRKKKINLHSLNFMLNPNTINGCNFNNNYSISSNIVLDKCNNLNALQGDISATNYLSQNWPIGVQKRSSLSMHANFKFGIHRDLSKEKKEK